MEVVNIEKWRNDLSLENSTINKKVMEIRENLVQTAKNRLIKLLSESHQLHGNVGKSIELEMLETSVPKTVEFVMRVHKLITQQVNESDVNNLLENARKALEEIDNVKNDKEWIYTNATLNSINKCWYFFFKAEH